MPEHPAGKPGRSDQRPIKRGRPVVMPATSGFCGARGLRAPEGVDGAAEPVQTPRRPLSPAPDPAQPVAHSLTPKVDIAAKPTESPHTLNRT
jgi:hypothetical protein